VPGLATLYNGAARTAIIKSFSQLGYTVKDQILYAPDYGIPQIRKRLFFVGILNGQEFEFPERILTADKYVTCGEAISDLHDFTLDDMGEEISNYRSEPLSSY